MHKPVVFLSALWCLSLAACEKQPRTVGVQPPPAVVPDFSQGLVIAGGESSIGTESIPDATVLANMLNLWCWKLPVKVPDDAIDLSLRLDHYQHDRWVSMLASSSFHRLNHRKELGTGVPTEDEITVVLRFPTDAATRELAASRSETCFLITSAKFMGGSRTFGSEFRNPFFRKAPGLGTGRVPPPLETGTDSSPEGFKARISLVESRSRKMSEIFQIGVLHSGDGTNIRLTFAINSRYHPPPDTP